MAIRWWWFHHWSCMKSQLLLDSYHSTVAGNQCFDVVDLVWLKWAENLRVVCLDVGYDFYKAPSHWSNAVGEKQNGLSCIFCLKWYFLKFFLSLCIPYVCRAKLLAVNNSFRHINCHGRSVCVCLCVICNSWNMWKLGVMPPAPQGYERAMGSWSLSRKWNWWNLKYQAATSSW